MAPHAARLGFAATHTALASWARLTLFWMGRCSPANPALPALFDVLDTMLHAAAATVMKLPAGAVADEAVLIAASGAFEHPVMVRLMFGPERDTEGAPPGRQGPSLAVLLASSALRSSLLLQRRLLSSQPTSLLAGNSGKSHSLCSGNHADSERSIGRALLIGVMDQLAPGGNEGRMAWEDACHAARILADCLPAAVAKNAASAACALLRSEDPAAVGAGVAIGARLLAGASEGPESLHKVRMLPAGHQLVWAAFGSLALASQTRAVGALKRILGWKPGNYK